MKKIKRFWQKFQNQRYPVDGNVEYLSLKQKTESLKQSKIEKL